MPSALAPRRLALALLALPLWLLSGCADDEAPIAAGGTAGAGASGGAGGMGGGAGGTAAGAGAAGSAGLMLPETEGCEPGVKLLATPQDPAARGPWPVGARTTKVGELTVEVWYPATPGSEQGKPAVKYDLRQWLPESEQGKIPDEATPLQECGCQRDLPLDEAHGLYPVVVFLHGTAGFRTQSLPHMEHWASRGFVVVAADYPGLYLGDALNLKLKNDLPGGTQQVLDALRAPSGGLAFLAGRIDMTRIGMAGHSAGGKGIQGFGVEPGVRVLIPLAAFGVKPSPTLESTVVVGGLADQVVKYENQTKGYESAAPPKRLIGLGKAGHLFPTDLCWMTNAAGQNIVQTATQYQIKNADLASVLFDCPPDLPRDRARDIINHVTTAAFEEKLTCKPGDPFATLQATFPEVVEFEQALE